MDKYCERCYLRDEKPCMECNTCNPGHRNFKPADRIPGACEVDKSAHRVYLAAEGKEGIHWMPSGVKCKTCGGELDTYYCEERLYMVRCIRCETVVLVKSSCPKFAAEEATT